MCNCSVLLISSKYFIKMYRLVLCSVVILAIFHLCDSARILGIIPSPSYSHQVVYRPIWKELALKGHELTVLTTDPMNDPSLSTLTEINLHSSYDIWNNKVSPLLAGKDFANPITMINTFFSIISEIIDLELQHPEVQTLLKNENEHFDLVMVEFMSPAMFAFAERFKCPSIGMLSLDAPSGMYTHFGNPVHPVLNPDFALPFGNELTFLERLISVVYNHISYYIYRNFLYREELTVKKHFGENFASLQKITANISLLFVNANPIFHRIRPLVPAIIPIGGGTHIQPSKPLPKGLKKILDGASQGFIYFSLGSNVKSKNLSERNRQILLQVFGELPYTILWKFELENLPDKPDNVIISKWFPQQDIFEHPHIKLFITQGGLQSMEEAILNNIPLIGMPFFGDQPANVNIMVSKGLGLSVDHEYLNKDVLKKTILEVIESSKYRNRVKEVAKLASDQPMTGLERAVWWTEYVLRHKGAEHLRSPALNIPSYQYYLLDVIGFCLIIVFIVLYLLFILIKCMCKVMRLLVASKSKEKTQ